MGHTVLLSLLMSVGAGAYQGRTAAVAWYVDEAAFEREGDGEKLRQAVRNAATLLLAMPLNSAFLFSEGDLSEGCGRDCISKLVSRRFARKILLVHWGVGGAGKRLMLKVVDTTGKTETVGQLVALGRNRNTWGRTVYEAVLQNTQAKQRVADLDSLDKLEVVVPVSNERKLRAAGVAVLAAGLAGSLVAGGWLIASDTPGSYASPRARRQGIMLASTGIALSFSVGLPLLFAGWEFEEELENEPDPGGLTDAISGQFGFSNIAGQAFVLLGLGGRF